MHQPREAEAEQGDVSDGVCVYVHALAGLGATEREETIRKVGRHFNRGAAELRRNRFLLINAVPLTKSYKLAVYHCD